MAQTDRQTNTQTHGHGDSKTNSAKRAELVKSHEYLLLTVPVRKVAIPPPTVKL